MSPAEPPLDPYGPLPAYPVQGTVGQCAPVQTPAQCVTQVYGGTVTNLEQYGLYGQMRLSPVQGVTLIGGGRLTWFDTDSQTLLPTRGLRTGYTIENRFTPYAGVVWDLTRQLNLYASYADSFTPQAQPVGRQRGDGGGIEPMIGAQYGVTARKCALRTPGPNEQRTTRIGG